MLIKLVLNFKLILITTALMSSCASPYFGYSEKNWHKLSALEQNKVSTEYHDIFSSKYNLRRIDEIDRLMKHRLSEYDRAVFQKNSTRSF